MRAITIMLVITSALVMTDIALTYSGASGSQGRGTAIIDKQNDMMKLLEQCVKR